MILCLHPGLVTHRVEGDLFAKSDKAVKIAPLTDTAPKQAPDPECVDTAKFLRDVVDNMELTESDYESETTTEQMASDTSQTQEPRAKRVPEFGVGARVIWAMSAGDRESEAQAKKGEEGAGGDRDSRAAAALKQYWCVGLRSAELILTIIAIGLVTGVLTSPHVFQLRLSHIAVIYSAYSSFIIITGILIIARLLGETIGWRTSIGFSVLGVIMFTAAAAVIFYDWHNSYYVVVRPNKQAYDVLLASGVFAVATAAVFLFHAFFTFRKEGDY